MPFLLWFSDLALPDLQLPRKMGAPKMLSNGRHSRVGAIIVARIGVLRGRAVDCHLHPHIMLETRVRNKSYLLRCDPLRNMELDSCGTCYACRKNNNPPFYGWSNVTPAADVAMCIHTTPPRNLALWLIARSSHEWWSNAPPAGKARPEFWHHRSALE